MTSRVDPTSGSDRLGYALGHSDDENDTDMQTTGSLFEKATEEARKSRPADQAQPPDALETLGELKPDNCVSGAQHVERLQDLISARLGAGGGSMSARMRRTALQFDEGLATLVSQADSLSDVTKSEVSAFRTALDTAALLILENGISNQPYNTGIADLDAVLENYRAALESPVPDSDLSAEFGLSTETAQRLAKARNRS